MKTRSLLIILLAALASASLTQAGGSADRTAEKVLADYAQAYNAGDSAALAQVYAEDAVMLPPNGEIVRGRAQIEAFWKKGMGKGLKLDVADAKLDGAVAFAAGIYSFLPGPKGPGPTDRGKFMVGLKKVSGSWKIAADIWNEPRPAEH